MWDGDWSDRPIDWTWSSARNHLGLGDCPVRIDQVVLSRANLLPLGGRPQPLRLEDSQRVAPETTFSVRATPPPQELFAYKLSTDSGFVDLDELEREVQ